MAADQDKTVKQKIVSSALILVCYVILKVFIAEREGGYPGQSSCPGYFLEGGSLVSGLFSSILRISLPDDILQMSGKYFQTDEKP